MAKKSFFENLRNLPADAMKEIKKAVSPGKEPNPQAAEAARTARAQEIAQAAQTERQRSEMLAEKKRAEIEAFFGTPSPSERGARLTATADTRPKPISLERTRLLQQREALLHYAERVKDEARRSDTLRRVAEIDNELKAA
jgi:hypothetical protein